jgi:hypothetical protein
MSALSTRSAHVAFAFRPQSGQAQAVFGRTAGWMLRRRGPLAMGRSLVAQRMMIAQSHNAAIWLNNLLRELMVIARGRRTR